MRTIKFRGRHLCGQWYYGNLIIRETDSPVPETPQAYKCVMIGDVEDGSAEEVEEETVGQFTGLRDKNGKEIYEGDIIDCVVGEYRESKSEPWKQQIKRFVVSFEKCAFRPIDHLTECKESLRIIGNIYDNPELLRGEPKQ